jgi:hypothetical protein
MLALFSLPFIGVGCTYQGTGRAPAAANAHIVAAPMQSDSQPEAVWLREEVRALRMSLAERDRREAELWRAYVELSQKLVQLQLQLAQQHAKQPEPEPVVTKECAPPSPVAAVEPAPRKAVVRLINNSQLKMQEKRELIQSMRPARAIDVVNPWATVD